MRQSDAVRRAGAALLLIAAAAISPRAAAPEDLASLRQECIDAARDVQQRERTVAAVEHDLELIEREAEGRRRGLDESRPEQANLLGTLLYLARHPPGAGGSVSATPLDRRRTAMLVEGTEPLLRAQARALAAEIERLATLRQRIAAKQRDAEPAREALASERGRLAGTVARRTALLRRLAPDDPAVAARLAKLGHDARDLAELIKGADEAAGRGIREPAARPRPTRSAAAQPAVAPADPTRPAELRPLADPAGDAHPAALVFPATIAGPPAAATSPGTPPAGVPSGGVGLRPVAGAVVVAPFDGQVVYAGPFRKLGLVLIIRHDHLYHSVLAGLARADLGVGDWVLAGEPVGAMPDVSAAKERSGGVLTFELRRDGRPVDPQPWLANDDRRDKRNGDQRVRE